jgi:hypothetical protein
MLTIKDIVDLDQEAEFRSDVQLGAYDDPDRNIALLRSYLFSTETPRHGFSEAGSASPVDLLDKVIGAYLNPKADNRLTVIADYGHGKSHLALALANYFGKPSLGPELGIIHDKLGRALNDPAKAARFRDFKTHRGPFLLIRIRGDVRQALPAQFLAGLEAALAADPDTRDLRPPFWHEQAERILGDLTPDETARANDALNAYDSELPLLLQAVRARDDVYAQAVEAIRAAKGFRPDLHDVSLSEAVGWVVNTVVGNDKPFGGLLVLFDEFTLFLSKHASHSGAGDLQELLNGIDDHRGKAAFVAFAQVDPETTADHLQLSGSHRAELKKALTRLQSKHRLYSLMESVIDAYLKQDKAAWEEFNQSRYVRGPLSNANETTHIAFATRYDKVLRWPPTRLQETVTHGCFPLHPLTTALLCNLRLQTVDTGVPRNVLGFVMQQLRAKQAEPAFWDEERRINWVLPIALVDYFEERLAGPAYLSFQNARRMLGIELTGEQEAILKALLLYELAELTVRGDDQLNFLGHAAGLERAATKDALRTLVDTSSIRHDSHGRVYNLWPAAHDPGTLDRKLQEKLKNLTFNAALLNELNDTAAKDLPGITFGSQPLDVDWGHPADWGPQELILTAAHWTPERLRSVAPITELGRSSLQEGGRSLIIWGLAQTEADVTFFREEAAAVLDETFGDDPPPVLLVVPRSPLPNLVEKFLRLHAIGLLNNTERGEIGADMLKSETERVKGEIVREFRKLREVAELPLDVRLAPERVIVPRAYRATANALGETNLKELLLKLYDLAYPHRPPTFDTRYPVVRSNKLRTTTAALAATFFRNGTTNLPQQYATNSFAKDLYQSHLQKKWGVLGPDLRLQRPKYAGLIQAWDLFDKAIAPGKASVRLGPLLLQLLNPPYGFDSNTATLLFAAWYGKNNADLRLSVNGSFSLDIHQTFDQWLNNGARDFIWHVNDQSVTITRREPGAADRELRELLDSYAQGLDSPAAARKTADNIEAMAAGKGISSELQQQGAAAAGYLREAADAAEQYAEAVSAFESELKRGIALINLLTLQRRLTKLQPPADKVIPVEGSATELAKQLYQATDEATNKLARRYSRLADIGDYGLHQKQLTDARDIVNEAGYTELVKFLDKALDDLKQGYDYLRSEESEKPLRTSLLMMRTDIPLAALYDQRANLIAMTPATAGNRALRDEKLAETTAEIEKLEADAKRLAAGALTHTDHRAIRAAYEELIDKQSRYAGSPLAETIAQARTLLDQAGKFLTDLAEQTQRIDTLSNPTDAANIRQALEQLIQKNESWLEGDLREKAARAVASLDRQTAAKTTEAETWLRKMESAAATKGNLVSLAEQLRQPPAFLPAEQRAQLETLQADVRHRIEDDAVARIEQEFRRITNPQTRAACLARLQALMEQGESAAMAPGTS